MRSFGAWHNIAKLLLSPPASSLSPHYIKLSNRNSNLPIWMHCISICYKNVIPICFFSDNLRIGNYSCTPDGDCYRCINKHQPKKNFSINLNKSSAGNNFSSLSDLHNRRIWIIFHSFWKSFLFIWIWTLEHFCSIMYLGHWRELYYGLIVLLPFNGMVDNESLFRENEVLALSVCLSSIYMSICTDREMHIWLYMP